MTAQEAYDKARTNGIEYDGNCTILTASKVKSLMEGSIRANQKKIEELIEDFYPRLADDLAIGFHNPYKSYRTETHLIYVHSAIEYFFRIKE